METGHDARSVLVVADGDAEGLRQAVTDVTDDDSVLVCSPGEATTAVTDRSPAAVVVRHDPPATDALGLVGRLRETLPELPVVIVADGGGGVVGGSDTAVVSPAADVSDRLAAVLGTDAGTAETDPFYRLHRITADPEREFEAQVGRLLRFGAAEFGTREAFLAEIDRETGRFEVVQSLGETAELAPGATHDLGETYCRRTVADDGAQLALGDAREAFADDPARERFGLGCYLGGEIVVDGETYGTLCFVDDEPRAPFTETERELAATMVRWLGQWLEHRADRRELTATRDRLRRIFERVTDAFFAVDETWAVSYVNEAGAAVLRGAMGADYTEAELLGRHLWEEIPAAVDTEFYEQYTQAMETGEPVTFESEYEPMDTWFEVRAFPDDEGLSVYFTDVTERKRREQTLNELLSASRSFILADDERTLADRVLAAAADVFDHSLAAVRLHDDDEGTLPPSQVTAAATDRVPDPPVYDDDEGLPGEAFQTGEAVIVDDLTAETAYDYDGVASAMFLPMGDHGTVSFGAAEPGAFDGEDAALAELLAVTAAAAFDRLDREGALRDLQRTVDHVDQKVFLLDGAGRFRLTTDRLAESLCREPVGDTTLADVVVPEDADDCRDAVSRLAAASPPDGTVFETTLDGPEPTPVEVELSAVATAGDDARVAGAVTDISELAATRDSLETARDRFRRLFESLSDPVVELEYVDGVPEVRYANPAFAAVFGHDTAEARGTPLAEIVGADTPVDGRVAGGERIRTEVERSTRTGRRDFLLQAVPHDRPDGTYAFAVYTEITEQKEREQYLQILNRVLRHNLRNDMNVVTMIAEELSAEVDDDRLAGYATQLAEKARDVASLSEKAKEIERVTGSRDEETRPVDLAHAARDAATRARAATDATVRTELPASAWVAASPDLQGAVEELLENAAEHAGPGADVTVSVTTAPGTDRPVRLRVTDDGPGIPPEEWAVVAGERDITQLDHGSGLGLWLVKWIVTACDGRLRRLDGGRTVEIRLWPSD